MKKLLFFLSLATILSCSKSDDDSSGANYNPPAWIQGTWGIKAKQNESENPLYKFEADNVCQLTTTITVCWKEQANLNSSASNLVAEDAGTASTYEAKYGLSGMETTIKFERISANQIKWINAPGGEYILDKLK